MKKFRFSWYVFVLLLFIHGIIAAQEDFDDGWKLEKDQKGIKIFTRKVEGFKLKEFKAITTIETSPEWLGDMIKGVDNYVKWMSHLASSHIIEKVSENEIYIYSESDVPWPFSNRDIVTKSIIYWEGNKVYVEMNGFPDYVPKKDGIVRMPYSEGLWIFNPVTEGLTEITYRYLGDPGGKIPGWVANMFIVDGPYKTLLGMKEYLLESQEK